jgi:hypothetical protein
MGISNITNTATSTKTYNNDKVIYIRIDGQEKSAHFKPSKAFENIVSNEDVLKIITKGDIRTTIANKQGYVNFVLGNGENQFGFLNFLTNTLNADSSEEAITQELLLVEATLSKVTLADISRPLTEDEARGALDML